MIFIGLSTWISVYGYQNGKPENVLTPVDSDNRYCGQGVNQFYPLIYFAAPSAKTLWRTVCVKTCPNATANSLDCSINSQIKNCSGKSGFDIGMSGVNFTSDTLIYPSVPLLNNLCFPVSTAIQNTISNGM